MGESRHLIRIKWMGDGLEGIFSLFFKLSALFVKKRCLWRVEVGIVQVKQKPRWETVSSEGHRQGRLG